jgi:fumarate reductase subunit C
VSILFNHKNSIIKNQTFHLEPLNQQKWWKQQRKKRLRNKRQIEYAVAIWRFVLYLFLYISLWISTKKHYIQFCSWDHTQIWVFLISVVDFSVLCLLVKNQFIISGSNCYIICL